MGIFHREILRLAKINAAEIKTNEGKKAARELTKILSGLEFLIVKTFQTDIYGRFIADVFLPKNSKQTDPQIVASQGIYLNQLLLEQGLVTNFN
jgi:endonuclease YncB( thermonuclease family)